MLSPAKLNGKLNLSNNRKWLKLHLFNRSNKLILLVFRSFSLKGIICGAPIFNHHRERVEPHTRHANNAWKKPMGNDLRLCPTKDRSLRSPRFCNRKRIIIAYVSSIDFNHSIQNSRFLAYATPLTRSRYVSSRSIPFGILSFTGVWYSSSFPFPKERNPSMNRTQNYNKNSYVHQWNTEACF